VEWAEDWKPSKHPTPLHVHELSLPVSPICAPAPNLLLLHRKSLFKGRSRGDPAVAGGGRGRASERAGSNTQVHLWKTVLGAVSTCKKQKM